MLNMIKSRGMGMLNKNRGDTLIEVVICIAIVGAVITGSYALASNSLQEGISSSEHTQAIKQAESQIEALKIRNKNSKASTWETKFADDSPISPIQGSCLDISATSELDATGNLNTNWSPIKNNFVTSTTPDDLSTDAGHYNPVCVHTVAATEYYINITAAGSSSSTSPTYLVTIRWNSIGSGPQSQAKLYYRF